MKLRLCRGKEMRQHINRICCYVNIRGRATAARPGRPALLTLRGPPDLVWRCYREVVRHGRACQLDLRRVPTIQLLSVLQWLGGCAPCIEIKNSRKPVSNGLVAVPHALKFKYPFAHDEIVIDLWPMARWLCPMQSVPACLCPVASWRMLQLHCSTLVDVPQAIPKK